MISKFFSKPAFENLNFSSPRGATKHDGRCMQFVDSTGTPSLRYECVIVLCNISWGYQQPFWKLQKANDKPHVILRFFISMISNKLQTVRNLGIFKTASDSFCSCVKLSWINYRKEFKKHWQQKVYQQMFKVLSGKSELV